MSDRTEEEIRLELAGYLAPIFRAAPETTKRRKIKVVDESGQIIREIDGKELLEQTAKRVSLEFDVFTEAKDLRKCVCGGPKKNTSKTCKDCLKANRKLNVKRPCVDCGAGIRKGCTRCGECSAKYLVSKININRCSDCAEECHGVRCRRCSDQFRRSLRNKKSCLFCGKPMGHESARKRRNMHRECRQKANAIKAPKCSRCRARLAPLYGKKKRATGLCRDCFRKPKPCICECGKKKSRGAKQCKKCASAPSGERSDAARRAWITKRKNLEQGVTK